MSRRVLSAMMLSIGLVLAVSMPTTATAASSSATAVIVSFKPGTDVTAEARAIKSQGGKVAFEYRHALTGLAATVPAHALRGLANNPRVSNIEVDQVATLVGEQSPAPWGLDRVDQQALPLDGSFSYADVTTGVTAYVVDTGVLAGHNEFAGRVSAGFTAISDRYGTSDCNGHGTHVAGTVAGTSYGVAKTAIVVPVRVLSCSGSGSYSGIIAGLDWIIGHHTAGVPAVANMSLGGGFSSALNSAVQRTIDDGVNVVVAAGNSNADACNSSPASAPNALTIGATDQSDNRANFSNFGTCLDLFAPGVGIQSAWFTSTTATASLSGTSMASPHVAGAVALLLGQNPTLAPSDVSAALLAQASPGLVKSAGRGSANLLLRVVAGEVTPGAATAPAAPSGVAATAGKRAATVTWTQGANGGAILTGQTVHVYIGATLVGTVSVSASATSATISGLTVGTSYTFRVSATNAIGTSSLSLASNAVTPRR